MVILVYNIYLIGDSEKIELFLSKIDNIQPSYEYMYNLKVNVNTIEREFRLIDISNQNITKYMSDYILFTYHPHITLQLTDETNYFKYIKEIQTITNSKHNTFVPVLLIIIDSKTKRSDSNYFFEHLPTFFRFFEVEQFKKYIYGPLYFQLQSDSSDIIVYELELIYNYLIDLCHIFSKDFVPHFRYNDIAIKSGISTNELKIVAYNDVKISSILEFEKSDFLDYEIFKKAKEQGCQNYRE